MKRIVVMLLLVLSAGLFCKPARAQFGCFQPHYSSYSSYALDGSGKVSQNVTASGYTWVNQVCLQFMMSAKHYAIITNKIGAVGGLTYTPQVCPTCQIDYTATATVVLDPGFQPTDGSTDVVFECTSVGTISGAGGIGSNFKIEVAVTREFSTGVLTNCHWLTGALNIEDCDVGSVPFCTVYTTPPDMHLSPTEWQVYPVPAPVFWDTLAICLRYITGPWACSHGIATPLVTPPLRDCTHNP
jgi:hypothetical protein